MEGARKLFDEIPERNVESWNGMIAGMVREGRFEEGLRSEYDSVLLICLELEYGRSSRRRDCCEGIHQAEIAMDLIGAGSSASVLDRSDSFVAVDPFPGTLAVNLGEIGNHPRLYSAITYEEFRKIRASKEMHAGEALSMVLKI
ncbi:hypothetical protein Droror1_Dr00019655 [Drosera rotundifolia]